MYIFLGYLTVDNLSNANEIFSSFLISKYSPPKSKGHTFDFGGA